MELYRKVRPARADGISKRAAAAHFNISRDTVEKALAFSVPPCYRRTAPIKRPKLDGFTQIIGAWLDGDKTAYRKQRLTAKRLFNRLRDEHGFTSGYTSSRTTSGSASCADRRCSCRWRILRGMHRRISARRSFSSLAILLEPMAHDGSPSNIGPISSSSTFRRATPASYGPTPQRRRRPGWIVLCPLETGPFETGVFR